MTKTDITLYLLLFFSFSLYIILCCTSIINLLPGTLYSQATTKVTQETTSQYNDPRAPKLLEQMANYFQIPVRTLTYIVITTITIVIGSLIYTLTSSITLTSIMVLGFFLASKLFLGV